MDNRKIGLAEAIKDLRLQLQEAMDDGDGKKLRFELQDIDLEFKCSVNRAVDAKAGVEFWLVNVGAGGKLGDEKTQTIKLKLKPKTGSGEPPLLSDREKRK
jgi:hypothetical protein